MDGRFMMAIIQEITEWNWNSFKSSILLLENELRNKLNLRRTNWPLLLLLLHSSSFLIQLPVKDNNRIFHSITGNVIQMEWQCECGEYSNGNFFKVETEKESSIFMLPISPETPFSQQQNSSVMVTNWKVSCLPSQFIKDSYSCSCYAMLQNFAYTLLINICISKLYSMQRYLERKLCFSSLMDIIIIII